MNPLLQALMDGRRALPAVSPLAPPAKPPIQKLRYTHEALIDVLIAEPWISQNELADRFGMSASWISTIICSDLFQSKLAERRDKLVDPEIRASLKTQFEGLLSRSMDILRHKLDQTPDKIPDQLAVQVAKIAGQSLGYGVKEARVSVQETHVHLEELGNNLVSLLRRRKAEVFDVKATEGGTEGRLLPSARGEDQQEGGLRAGQSDEAGKLPASHLGVQPAAGAEVPVAGDRAQAAPPDRV